MSSKQAPGSAHAPWSDGRDLLPSLPIILTMNAVLWTLAAWLSSGNLDVTGDMVENYVWGIEWQAGYSKHPPLFAWITAAWFGVFPRTDWAYFVLSTLNVAAGLLGVAALARRFLPNNTAVFAALALAVSPLYSTLATKFNANAVLLSLWPWTVFFFVVYMQEGRHRHALACGAFAALSLLGKYFSVVLVMALLVVALVSPNWRHRLRGAGPWLAITAGLIVLLPHILWMFDHHFTTLRFASQRSEGSLGPALVRLVNYCAAQVAYLLPSAIFLTWALPAAQRREGAKTIVVSLFRPAQHRELWWLAFAPMLVVAAIAAMAGTQMASVWGMAQWFALTALWLAALAGKGIAPRAEWLRVALPVYWFVVLLIALTVGYLEALQRSPGALEPRAELARAAHGLWQKQTGRPLPMVGGSPEAAMSIAFYAPGKTRWWSPDAPESTPWLSIDDWNNQGGLLVCAEGENACDRLAQSLGTQPAVELSLHKNLWGMTLPAMTYRVYLRMPSKPYT